MKASLLCVMCLVACGGGGTSLDGPADCFGRTCVSGQVCISAGGGVDAGSGESTSYHECRNVSPDCDLVDCSGSMCSTCIQKLCEPTGVSRVVGRDVLCYGQ